MALTETDYIIIGVATLTVVIVSGLILWYICHHKPQELVPNPDYTKPGSRTPTPCSNSTDLDINTGTETQSMLSQNNNESNLSVDIDSENGGYVVELTPHDRDPMESSERTNIVAHSITKNTEGDHNEEEITECDEKETTRTHTIHHADEMEDIQPMGVKYWSVIAREKNKYGGNDVKINMEENKEHREEDVSHSHAEDEKKTLSDIEVERVEYSGFTAKQIQSKLEQAIAFHSLSDLHSCRSTTNTCSESTGSWTWTDTNTTGTVSTCVTSWEEYREHLRNLFDLFSGNAPCLSILKFNTFLDIVVIRNSLRSVSHWNLSVDQNITRSEFVEYFCTANIKKHIERQVSWQLLTKVWKGLNEIDVNRSGVLGYRDFRSLGVQLELNCKEIEIFWKRLAVEKHRSEYVTVTVIVFEWFKQRLEALAQQSEKICDMDSTDRDDCSDISTSHSNTIADSALSD